MGKTLSSREVIKALLVDDWFEVNHVGSHKQFKHPTKKGRVTVQHPVKELSIGNNRGFFPLERSRKDMGVRYYPAILERVENGLTVSFPDFRGCVAFGEDFESVAANAEAALSLHLAGMIEDGNNIPEPSRLEDIPADPEVSEAGRLLVRAELPGKAVRVNISLEEGLLAAIDAEAKRRDTSRSGFLAAAARRELVQQAASRLTP